MRGQIKRGYVLFSSICSAFSSSESESDASGSIAGLALSPAAKNGK
jgi:hypothetical protein